MFVLAEVADQTVADYEDDYADQNQGELLETVHMEDLSVGLL